MQHNKAGPGKAFSGTAFMNVCDIYKHIRHTGITPLFSLKSGRSVTKHTYRYNEISFTRH